MKNATVSPDNHGWISTADTAKLVRQALAAEFPAVKFSVRSKSYSGGASINVNWTDGPTEKQVGEATSQFCAGRFDGMIDLAYSVRHWLMPDGTAIVARDPGTVGSRGVNESYENAKPHPDAVPVRFGADHISCSRALSVPFLSRIAQRVTRRYGMPMPTIIESGAGYGASCGRDGDVFLDNSDIRLCEAIWRVASRSVIYQGCLCELNL